MRTTAFAAMLAALLAAACGKLGPPLRAPVPPEAGANQPPETPETPEPPGPGSEAETAPEESP